MHFPCLLFLLACSLGKTSALKCLCSFGRCMTVPGPAVEECGKFPDSFVKDNFPVFREQLIAGLRRYTAEFRNVGEFTQYADPLLRLNSSSMRSPTSIIEGLLAMAEIAADKMRYLRTGKGDLGELQDRMRQMVHMQGEPASPRFQFCVKANHSGGIAVDEDEDELVRGCGTLLTLLHGPVYYNEGCGTSDLLVRFEYCRCINDLCNKGDIPNYPEPVVTGGTQLSTNRVDSLLLGALLIGRLILD